MSDVRCITFQEAIEWVSEEYAVLIPDGSKETPSEHIRNAMQLISFAVSEAISEYNTTVSLEPEQVSAILHRLQSALEAL